MLVKQSEPRILRVPTKMIIESGLLSSLQSLSDFRMHAADVLCTNFITIDHTLDTLELMREAHVHDAQKLAQIELLEHKISFTLKHRPRLHSEILASAISVMRLAGARSVLDVGCGEGLLLRALLEEKSIERVTGIDIDENQLRVARELLARSKTTPSYDIDLRLTEDVKDQHDLKGVDVAAVLEVVEHIADKRWIDNVFALRPKHLVVSTPNRDFNTIYNPKYLTPDGFRDSDHKFEFTQEEFMIWAKDSASRHGYIVDLLPIGQSTMEHGSSVLMAVFTRRDQ